MFLRLGEILLILILLFGALFYLYHAYVAEPRRKAEQENVKVTEGATKKARVEYLEIRRNWINHSLSTGSDFYEGFMDDMKIPEVAKYQKIMIVLNDKYDDLPEDMETDASFVAKVTALRTAYDEAVIAAKKKSLS